MKIRPFNFYLLEYWQMDWKLAFNLSSSLFVFIKQNIQLTTLVICRPRPGWKIQTDHGIKCSLTFKEDSKLRNLIVKEFIRVLLWRLLILCSMCILKMINIILNALNRWLSLFRIIDSLCIKTTLCLLYLDQWVHYR